MYKTLPSLNLLALTTNWMTCSLGLSRGRQLMTFLTGLTHDTHASVSRRMLMI